MAAPAQDQSEVPQQCRHFEVPAMIVQHFVGRKQLLERMDNLMGDDDKGDGRTKMILIRGMGGS